MSTPITSYPILSKFNDKHKPNLPTPIIEIFLLEIYEKNFFAFEKI